MKLIVFFLFILCQITKGQAVADIKNMYIIGYADNGYRVGHVLPKIKELDNNHNLFLKEINTYELDSLMLIISQAKIKRIVDGKLSGNFLFIKAKTNLNQTLYMSIDNFLISDYSNKKNYWIRNQKHKDYLKYFILNYRPARR